MTDLLTQLSGQARELHEQLQRASVSAWIRQPVAARVFLREAAEQLDAMRAAIATAIQPRPDP